MPCSRQGFPAIIWKHRSSGDRYQDLTAVVEVAYTLVRSKQARFDGCKQVEGDFCGEVDRGGEVKPFFFG